VYREQNPYKPPPPDYKPPSVLAEHKGLAILVAAILIGFLVYGWKALHAPARRSAQPIYIEAVPGDQLPSNQLQGNQLQGN
jgi:hypothetical protein